MDVSRVLEDADVDLDTAPGTSLSPTAIAQFLVGTGGAIGWMTFDDRGTVRSTPDIIADAAMSFRVSSQYLLALLEKEMGLASDSSPTANQLNFAMGYGCPSSCDSRYAGFAKQVRLAAEQTRAYLDDLNTRNLTTSGWGVGVAKTTLDGITVVPVNRITAALYTYNPVVGVYGGGDGRYGGVSLLWKIWGQWFTLRHPDGSLLRARGQIGVWLLENGTKRPFHSKAALYASYDPRAVIDVDVTELALYPTGIPIDFPGVGLVRIETGGVYLLVNGEKRPIQSREIFRGFGFNPEEVQKVALSQLAGIPTGTPLSLDEQYPTGKLFQIRGTGGVVWVKDGIRHAVLDRAVWRNRFGGERPSPITLTQVLQYPKGDPVGFRDGTLVRAAGDGSVYVISNGQKLPFTDPVTFRRLGYKWARIVVTTQAVLALHPTGPAITSVVN